MLNFKYYNTKYLIVVILLLSFVFDKIINDCLLPLLVSYNFGFIRVPGNVSLITLFLILYDNYLWKFPIFKLLVTIPNISGRYKGFIKYNFDGKLSKIKCIIEIIQTASNIKLHTYIKNSSNEKSQSISIIESIIKDTDNFYKVYFFYFNGGNKMDSTLDAHEGANVLKYYPKIKNDKSKLIGHYFTNRNIQTKGEIEVIFKSKKIKGKY